MNNAPKTKEDAMLEDELIRQWEEDANSALEEES